MGSDGLVLCYQLRERILLVMINDEGVATVGGRRRSSFFYARLLSSRSESSLWSSTFICRIIFCFLCSAKE
jgi:hypothetical protein